MDEKTMMIGFSLVLFSTLIFFWAKTYGPILASLAALCRVLWILPLILIFFPKEELDQKEEQFKKNVIHILIDDSNSMLPYGREVQKTLSILKDLSSPRGLELREVHLSEEESKTSLGFSPLSRFLERHAGEDFIFLSDGADSEYPRRDLKSFKEKKASKENPLLQIMVDVSREEIHHVSIDQVDLPEFWFEDKPLSAFISLSRFGEEKKDQYVQVHVKLGETILKALDLFFPEGSSSTEGEFLFEGLPRGNHFLSFELLPTSNDPYVYDHRLVKNIEVASNTVGVLHLLGSPNWDGRYLRRYLKLEPKFDLISFFILRDPTDLQNVSERELSLIPFPVDRLFGEELKHFKMIVMQNFSLYPFLQPDYQKNLVRYVKEGGSLLFMGGEKAFGDMDLMESPLKEILPFSITPGEKVHFDPDLPYKVVPGTLTKEQRSIASVYEDWTKLSLLWSFDGFKGIHLIDEKKFSNPNTSVLISAQPAKGSPKVPLVVASYPEKGRALWVLSDSLWRLAQKDDGITPREVYYRFLESGMRWLLRKELASPLEIRSLSFQENDQKKGSLLWEALIEGGAASFFNPKDQAWKVNLCGIELEEGAILRENLTDQTVKLSGIIQAPKEATHGLLRISGAGPAFGSVDTKRGALLPKLIPETETFRSRIFLEHLPGTKFLPVKELSKTTLEKFLKERFPENNGGHPKLLYRKKPFLDF